MAVKQENVVTRMQELAAEATAQQVRLIEQYAELYQKFLNNETTAIDPSTAAQFWLSEGSSYVQRVAEMNLRLYSEFFDMSRGLAERYLDLVSGRAKKASKPAAATTTERPQSSRKRAAKARKRTAARTATAKQ